MTNKISVLLLFGLLAVSIILGGGCKKKPILEESSISEVPTSTPTQVPTQIPTETPIPTPQIMSREGYVISKLTGLWVEEEIGNKRPYSIIFNNIKYASPQSGIEEAAVLYEALVEGGITRLMGIFEELHEERIGSVRSARHYFVSFADEFDSIFVHFGETTYATKKLKALAINNLSGLTGVGDTVFYRDKTIKEPHNAFTNKDKILEGTKIKGYETEYQEEYEGHFMFYEVDTDLLSDESAKKVTFNFSSDATSYFTYHESDKLYYRFQFGTKHIDANSGNQLAFKNIIVQFVKQWDIDKNDYQTMDIEDSKGNGYYITNGKKVDITWSKNEKTKIMRYYDKDGNVLAMNPGKTFIAIFPNDQTKGVLLEDKAD